MKRSTGGQRCLCCIQYRRTLVGFEVFTAVTMKNAVFWDINTQFNLTGNTLRLRYRVQPVTAM
jgi:hypothetical protein